MNKVFNKFNWQAGVTEAYEDDGHTWAFILYSMQYPPLPRILPVNFQLPNHLTDYGCYVRHKHNRKVEHTTSFSGILGKTWKEWKTKE